MEFLIDRLKGTKTIRSFIDTWVGPGHNNGSGWLVTTRFIFHPGTLDTATYASEVIPLWNNNAEDRIVDPVLVGDAAERDIAGPDAELGLDVALRHVDGRDHERCRVENRARGGHPAVVGLGRAEEDQGRQRGVAFLDLGEPLLPCRPGRFDLVHATQPVEASDHLDGRGRRAGLDIPRPDGTGV